MRKPFALAIVPIICLTAFPVTNPQKEAALRFFELRERTLDQRGTAHDIDELLSLLTDNSKYEHPAASVTMTRAEARSGMLAHLREGKDAKYTLRRARFTNNFAVVEYVLEYTLAGKRVSRGGAAVFEFSGDKISRLAEY